MSDYRFKTLLPRKKTLKERSTDLVWEYLPLLIWVTLGIIILGFLIYCQSTVAYSHDIGWI